MFNMDCFVAGLLAMTEFIVAARNDGLCRDLYQPNFLISSS